MATYDGALKRYNGSGWDTLLPTPGSHTHNYLPLTGGTLSNRLIIDYSATGGDGTWDKSGILIKNMNGSAAETAIAFQNSATTTDLWIHGLNQSAILKWGYGPSFTDGYSKMELNTSGNLSVSGSFVGPVIGNASTSSDSAKLNGVVSSESATPSTIVKRTSANYIYGGYFNSNRGNETSTAASYIYDTGDGWMRKKTLADAKSELVDYASVTAAVTNMVTGSTYPGAYAPAAGSLLRYTSVGWDTLNIGTDGQVLKLVSGLPTWSSDNNSNNYLTSVTGSGNGNQTFKRSGLSDLTFNAAHTHTFGSLTAVPSTLAGHGINNAYTKNEVDNKTDLKSNTDNRSVATVPNDYNSKFEIKGLKQNSVIGLTTGSTYSALLGLRGWTDSSGGNSHELAFDAADKIYHRSGATTTWGDWKYLIESDDLRLTDARTPVLHTLDSHAGTLTQSNIKPGSNGQILKTVSGVTAWATDETGSNNYLTGVTGSGNGTMTFARNGLGNLTFNAAHTHDYLPSNGNAVSATKLQNINTSFSGTYPMVVNVSGVLYSNANMTYNGTSNTITSPNFAGSLSGNASTATQLATIRKINGVNFNGTSDITITADPNAHTQSLATITTYAPANHVVITTGTALSYTSALNASIITSGTFGTARLGSGSASGSTFLRGDGTWAAPSELLLYGTDMSITENNDNMILQNYNGLIGLDAASGVYINGTEIKDYVLSSISTKTTSTIYTLSASDRNKFIRNTSSSASTFRIPADASNTSFPIGSEIHIMQEGTGVVTIQALSGVTLRSQGNKTKIDSQYQVVTLKKLTASIWVLFGALKA